MLLNGRNAVGTMKRKANKKDSLDIQNCLGAAGKFVTFPKQRTIFTQGDSADTVFYLKHGIVKLSLTNETGKEAVIALLSAGDFLGRGASAVALQCAWRRPLRWHRQPCWRLRRAR